MQYLAKKTNRAPRQEPSFLEGVPINSRSFSWLISPTKIIASARDLVSRLHAIFEAQVERLQQGNPICVTCYILKYSPHRAVGYKLERCGFTRRSGREFNSGHEKARRLVNIRTCFCLFPFEERDTAKWNGIRFRQRSRRQYKDRRTCYDSFDAVSNLSRLLCMRQCLMIWNIDPEFVAFRTVIFIIRAYSLTKWGNKNCVIVDSSLCQLSNSLNEQLRSYWMVENEPIRETTNKF